MQCKGPGDGGIALRHELGDFGAAAGTVFAHFPAIAAMHKPVAVAGLAAAFLLKRNPRLDFRTHSNHRKMKGASPLFCRILSDAIVGKTQQRFAVDMCGAVFGADPRTGLAKTGFAGGG